MSVRCVFSKKKKKIVWLVVELSSSTFDLHVVLPVPGSR
jgi:hypothetical protein